jgi:hypothetical protein
MNRTHSVEMMSAAIAVEMARYAVVVIVRSVVEGIECETPCAVDKRDWAVEVVVGHQRCPLSRRKKSLQGDVATAENIHIVVIVIAQSHIVEIVVDATDVVVVDIIQVVE